jgi:hypothetical protein
MSEAEAPLFGQDGTPTTAHVQQGAIGDCFFMATLISLVNLDPALIQSMMYSLPDGTVAVRFFRRTMREGTPAFSPEWVRVNKNLVVNAESQTAYAGIDTALWPAILEKAYSVWRASGATLGFDRINQGGNMSDVMMALLGQEAVKENLHDPTDGAPADVSQQWLRGYFKHPFKMTRAELVHAFSLADERADAFVSAAQAAIGGELMDHPEKLESLDYVLSLATTAGFARTAIDDLREYVRPHLQGTSLAGTAYTARAEALYMKIKSALVAGETIGLSTKDWGRTVGTGRSAGENTETVPGLVSTHAYAVLGVKTDRSRKYLRIRNPWGTTGMIYKKRSVFSSELARVVDLSKAEFDLELSDVFRFFDNIYHT